MCAVDIIILAVAFILIFVALVLVVSVIVLIVLLPSPEFYCSFISRNIYSSAV